MDMKHWRVGLSVAALAALLAGCGYVGEPHPPALNIPVSTTDLRAVERGDQLVVEFTSSQMTTEGLLLKTPGPVELRVGAGQGKSFDFERWLAGAARIDVVKPEFGPMHIETPAKPWAGKEILLAVRTGNHKNRFSEWSNLVAIPMAEPLAQPAGFRVVAVSEGVQVSWRMTPARPGAAVRVFRKGPTEQKFTLLTRAEGDHWIDPGAQYGKRYEYQIQAVLKAGDSEAESLMTAAAGLVPEDHFPPAVPSGLTVLASAESIELTWERNTEVDLAGYHVYRAVAGGKFERIAEMLAAPSFNDRKFDAGKRYRYTVSAVDQVGNESAPSSPVEVTAP
jgi:hypothetical protein